MLAKQIGANIKAARKAQNLSLQKVAARLNPPTSYQQVSRLEQGRMLTIEWIERIAGALGVNPLDLIVPGQQLDFSLSGQVADEVARVLATVAREGEEPENGTVQAVSLLLQELSATFARHPQAYRDPAVARPVVDLAARRFGPAAN